MGCKIQLCGNSHRLPPARRAYGLDGRHSGICAHSVLQFRYFALYRQMAERRQERTAQNGRHTEYGARVGLRFPHNYARDGGGLLGRRLRNGALGGVYGEGRQTPARKDVPCDEEVCKGLQILGRFRLRQAQIYMAHAPSSALRRLGCARRKQDERMAEAQQVDGNGKPVPTLRSLRRGWPKF